MVMSIKSLSRFLWILVKKPITVLFYMSIFSICWKMYYSEPFKLDENIWYQFKNEQGIYWSATPSARQQAKF